MKLYFDCPNYDGRSKEWARLDGLPGRLDPDFGRPLLEDFIFAAPRGRILCLRHGRGARRGQAEQDGQFLQRAGILALIEDVSSLQRFQQAGGAPLNLLRLELGVVGDPWPGEDGGEQGTYQLLKDAASRPAASPCCRFVRQRI